MKHDIAVVIATYKRPELLARCLDCLSRQRLDVHQYQLVVISDGPDDTTRAVLEEFHSRYPHLSMQYDHTNCNEGPATARNLGWNLADANWIAFTDDDCLPDPYWLQNFLRTATDAKGPVVMTGRVIVPHSGTPTDYEKNIAALETADFVTANCCCPKVSLEKVGGFDTDYKSAWREDSDLHFKFLQHSLPIEKVETAIVVHPVRRASWGVSLREQRKSMYNALLFKKYPAYYRLLIAKQPVWRYYIIVASFLLGGFFMLTGTSYVGMILLANFLAWVLHFTYLRLRGTSKSFGHITEMLVTSFIIPFTSIYWTLYGSMKYKVLFL